MPTAPDPHHLAARLELARNAAKEAAALTLQYFQKPGLEVEWKPNNSPVSIADKKSEELLRARITRAFPHDAILGEEFGRTEGSTGFTWILDPIDGTQSFIRGISTYAVLVGVEFAGRAVAGVAELPGMHETLYASEGHGAFWSVRGEPFRRARVSETPTLDKAWVELAQAKSFMRNNQWPLYESVVKAAWRVHGWIDADAFALVATGRVDAGVQWGVSAWDIAPFDCILHEAGGRLSGWDGSRSLENKYVVASNAKVHDELLSHFKPYAPKGM